MPSNRLLLSLLWCLLSVSRAHAQAPPAEAGTGTAVSYYREIRPIFQARCQGCHQPAKRGGQYVMTDFARLIAGGESGEAAIEPGDPDGSYLVEQIAATDGSAAMPKNDRPLAGEQVELIRRWIAEGAKDDTPVSTQARYDMEHPPEYAAPPVITSLDFSPDGQLLAVSGYHEVVLHRATGDGIVARLVGLSERIESARFSPDGKHLAVTGGSPGRMGELQVWNVAERRLELSRIVGFDTCYGASWSGDGQLVAFGCPDNSVRAVRAAGGEQVLYNGAHNDWVLDTVFSLESDHVVSVSRDRSMKLINVPTQRFVDNITSITPGALKGGLHAVARNPSNNELATGGADGTPKIYRMFREKDRKIGDDFNLLRALPSMPGRIFDVSFSADGQLLAAGSSFNGSGEVRVYRVSDGVTVLSTSIPQGGIFSVALSPDGQTLAAGGFDGRVRLFRVEDGQLVREFAPAPLQPSPSSSTP